jgi:cysteine desulfurase/selenocysteine lyase
MAIDQQDLEQLEERIDDHVNEPYHRGPCSGCTHAHEGENPLCGDVVRLEIELDDRGTLRQVWFSGHGCRISQAAASMLAEHVEAKTLDEVKRFSAADMLRLFGARLTPNRQKCCLLPWRVLQAAIYSPSSRATAGGNGHTKPSPAGLPGKDRRRPAGIRPLDPHALRRDFAIFSRPGDGGRPLVYLDNAATTQRPRQVIQAIVDAYENHSANIHRGVHRLAEEATGLYEGARRTVCRFLNASSPQEIVFTGGATAAINLVARAWGDAHLAAGDEILVTEMEHHSNLVPWHQLAARTGARIRYIPLTDDGRLELDRLDRLLGPRTRLVAVTAASNVLGTINPIGQIVARTHEAGAVVLVDGAQSVPHQKTDVAAWDCDFLAFSGHKMLGPTGIGVLYGKRELLEATPPFLGGGGMIDRVEVDRFCPAGLGDEADPRPARFEAGTPPIVQAIGLAAAIEYLGRVGFEAMVRHEQRLTERAFKVLGAIPGLRILGPPPDARGGIVAFTLVDRRGRSLHGHDVAERLDREGIAVRASHHCAEPLHRRYGVDASIRASFYFYNTLEEIDLLGEALQTLVSGSWNGVR